MTEQLTVIQALTAVMQDVTSVGKGGFNQQQQFKFRGVDAVVNAVGPALRRHGVVVMPKTITHDLVLGSTTTGKSVLQARVMVKYTFYGPAGDSVSATVPGESMDSGDKSTAKAMSVAFRTALIQALALPTDEPDPDSQVYELSEKQPHRMSGAPAPVPGLEEWAAAVESANGDFDALGKLMTEAREKKAHPAIQEMIKVAGNAAMAKTGGA